MSVIPRPINHEVFKRYPILELYTWDVQALPHLGTVYMRCSSVTLSWNCIHEMFKRYLILELYTCMVSRLTNIDVLNVLIYLHVYTLYRLRMIPCMTWSSLNQIKCLETNTVLCLFLQTIQPTLFKHLMITFPKSGISGHVHEHLYFYVSFKTIWLPNTILTFK